MRASSTIPTVDTWDAFDKLFGIEVARFSRVFPECSTTRWTVTDGPFTLPGLTGYRDVAYADLSRTPRVVVFHRKILGRRVTNVVAVIRHELGHVCDRFAITEPAGREQRADNLAEYVTGERIFYDKDHVQTVESGTYPRPRHLHQ